MAKRGRWIPFFLTGLGLISLTACAGISSHGGSKRGQDAAMIQPLEEQFLGRGEPERRDPSSDAGLWKDMSSRDLFQDMRACKVGDLVTVNIVETSKASKTANTKTARESSIDAGIDNLLGWEGKIKNLSSFGKESVGNAFDNKSMFKSTLKKDFGGSGSTTRDESMTASVTARVMDVRPDGNLFIKGTRQVKVNNETQFIVLSGLIRHADISPDNTILSSYIADATIEYTGRGPVSDKQSEGWLGRAVDFVWPF